MSGPCMVALPGLAGTCVLARFLALKNWIHRSSEIQNCCLCGGISDIHTLFNFVLLRRAPLVLLHP